MREFRINEFLSLRLEGEWTNIYVGKVQFRQCTILLLNIIEGEESEFDKVESIDEAAEMVGASMENSLDLYKFIPPEVEFWGHCSNLQVWYEHDYDTRLIHSNLAFPLLRKLTEAGDPLAKKVFKTEIVQRYKNGTDSTRDFLEIEKFLEFLTIDEKLNLILDEENFTTFQKLSEEIHSIEEEGDLIDYPIIELLSDRIDSERIKIENRQITKLDLWNIKLREFPRSILQFNSLKILSLTNTKIKEIPQDIDKLSNLKELWLDNNILRHIPETIGNLKNLKHLWLGKNKIHQLPKSIGDLTELKILELSKNLLNRLPNSICRLRKLEKLFLLSNNLAKLPECLKGLTSLKYIDLRRNNFANYPEILKKIKSLKEIEIGYNNF